MIGLHFLYKVLKEGRADYLLKVPSRWYLTTEEKKELKRIKNYILKYHKLPSPPDEIPVGYNDETLDYYIDALRNRYCVYLLQIVKLKPITEETAEKLLRFLYSEITNLYTKASSDSVIDEKELPREIDSVITQMRLNKVAGILGFPTGYSLIDRNVGGLIRGEVIVFVARLKIGKTMYLLNIARKVARERKAMFISMEMPIRSIIKRLVALETGTSVFTDTTRLPSSFLDEAYKKINLNLILVNGANLRGLDDLYSIIQFYKPEIVFIDGAYLFQFDSYRSEWERAKNTIELLRKLALNLDVALAVTWQLSRAYAKQKDKERVEDYHIAYSDAVAQSATAVIAITQTQDNRLRKFTILCNREGETGEFLAHWDWINMNFEETKSDMLIETMDEEDIDEWEKAWEEAEEGTN